MLIKFTMPYLANTLDSRYYIYFSLPTKLFSYKKSNKFLVFINVLFLLMYLNKLIGVNV